MIINAITWKKYSNYANTWVTLDVASSYEVAYAVGFVVAEDEYFVTLASNTASGTYAGVYTIPTSSIISREKISAFKTDYSVNLSIDQMLSYEKENVTEVPTTFHGIDVATFISKYNTSTQKELADYFNSSLLIVDTLSSILIRLGKISTVLSNTYVRPAFVDTVDSKAFINDYKSMSVKEVAKKYNISTTTVNNAAKHFKVFVPKAERKSTKVSL